MASPRFCTLKRRPSTVGAAESENGLARHQPSRVSGRRMQNCPAAPCRLCWLCSGGRRGAPRSRRRSPARSRDSCNGRAAATSTRPQRPTTSAVTTARCSPIHTARATPSFAKSEPATMVWLNDSPKREVGGEVQEPPRLVGHAVADRAQRGDGDDADEHGADGGTGEVRLPTGEVADGVPPRTTDLPGEDARRTCTPTRTAMVSPRMRCQTNSRSSRHAARGRRGGPPGRGRGAAADAARPLSCVSARGSTPAAPSPNCDQPPCTIHMATTTAT